MTMSDITQSQDDVYEEYIDQNTDDPDDAGGTSPHEYSLPDTSPDVAITDRVATAIREEVDRERKYRAGLDSTVVTVNPNASGSIQFKTLTIGSQPVMIVQEKRSRGDTVIVVQGGASVSIGLHPGIMFQGTDTTMVQLNNSRTIRTFQALWAVAATATESLIDIQEEFD